MPSSKKHKTNDHTRSVDVLNALTRRELEYDPLIDPWLRQPTESPRNHGLFLMYRDHGRIRTVAQVAEMASMAYSTIARIARSNKWVERAGRWDADQDRIANIRLQAAREEMAKSHSAAARKLMKKALDRLETLDIESISPHALVLMLDTAARIERAALGLEVLNKGASAGQTSVAVTATTDAAGKPEVRVEVGVQHDRIMATLDDMVKRMSAEQIAAGYEELTASAEEAMRGLDAALPAPPPQ